jgi:hypothetical protein
VPSKSKTKGNLWELEVSKYLSNLYGESFTRAPSSGARIGGSNRINKEKLSESQIRAFKGDIIPGESFSRLNIECKSYKSFPFHQLYSGKSKLLDSWIEQMLDCADPGDINIIFLKVTSMGTWVFIEKAFFPPLITDNYFDYNSTIHGSWIMMDMKNFFNKNKEIFKKTLDKNIN